jgi:hypothetical protein
MLLSGCTATVAPAASDNASEVASPIERGGPASCASKGVSLASEGAACGTLADTCTLATKDGDFECGCVTRKGCLTSPGESPPDQSWTCRKKVEGCPSVFSGAFKPSSGACTWSGHTCDFIDTYCGSCDAHCDAGGKVDQAGCVG